MKKLYISDKPYISRIIADSKGLESIAAMGFINFMSRDVHHSKRCLRASKIHLMMNVLNVIL